MSNYSPYNGGKAAFARGKRQKPTNDKKFMEHYSSLAPKPEESGDGNSIRMVKQEAMLEWKKGWLDAKTESEAPKKKKKKVFKKKISKKKSKK